MRDGYSNFGFFQCLKPNLIVTAALTGEAIDTRGYETVLIGVVVGTLASAGALSVDNRQQCKLEHMDSAIAGAAWSEVYPSQMIHSVVGPDGAYSTLNSGIWQSLASTEFGSKVYTVGYKGPRRYVRLVMSQVGAPSQAYISGFAVLGLPAIWPISTPV